VNTKQREKAPHHCLDTAGHKHNSVAQVQRESLDYLFGQSLYYIYLPGGKYNHIRSTYSSCVTRSSHYWLGSVGSSGGDKCHRWSLRSVQAQDVQGVIHGKGVSTGACNRTPHLPTSQKTSLISSREFTEDGFPLLCVGV
jgi:hypothetical protein